MPRKPYALVMEFMRNPLSWFRVHPVAQAKVTDTSISHTTGHRRLGRNCRSSSTCMQRLQARQEFPMKSEVRELLTEEL
jgi:hypothetical protein